MSNYISKALNPITHKIEQVQMWDDWFGQHEYGVRFSDGNVYPEDQVVCIHPNDAGSNDVLRVYYRFYPGIVEYEPETPNGHYNGEVIRGVKHTVRFGGHTLDDCLVNFQSSVDNHIKYIVEDQG